MMMSPTSEVTMPPKAAPMMTPTARSTTLPFIANSRNSFSIADTSICPDEKSPADLVDQPGMHHGIADHFARWRRHRHQWQAHFFFQPSQQLQAMLGSSEARLLEDSVVQRHQPVLNFQSRGVVALQHGGHQLGAQLRRHIADNRDATISARRHIGQRRHVLAGKLHKIRPNSMALLRNAGKSG